MTTKVCSTSLTVYHLYLKTCLYHKIGCKFLEAKPVLSDSVTAPCVKGQCCASSRYWSSCQRCLPLALNLNVLVFVDNSLRKFDDYRLFLFHLCWGRIIFWVILVMRAVIVGTRSTSKPHNFRLNLTHYMNTLKSKSRAKGYFALDSDVCSLTPP